MLPVMTHRADLHLPALLSLPFWRAALILYLGYVLVIAVFFLLKWIVMGARR